MKILLIGATGAMGHAISRRVHEKEKLEIVAGVGVGAKDNLDFPIYHDVGEVKEEADVIIDFSHYSLVESTLNYALTKNLPIIIGTTGLTEAEHKLIDKATEKIPILQSGNMSLGISVMRKLVSLATQALKDFDVEIIEAHHNKKVDAPSGTAQMLADEILGVREEGKLLYGRHGRDVKRQDHDITLHSIRGGSIIGEHEVLLAGLDEVLTIKHQALSKNIFAEGALAAVNFITKAKPGRYQIEDII